MLCLLIVFNDVLVKLFVPHRSIIELDIGIRLRLSGVNMLNSYLTFFRASQQFTADVFRAVGYPNSLRLAVPFNNLVQTSDHPLRGKREVNLDTQTFAVEVIQNIRKPKRTPVAKPVRRQACPSPSLSVAKSVRRQVCPP
jgi:hypothetical protein